MPAMVTGAQMANSTPATTLLLLSLLFVPVIPITKPEMAKIAPKYTTIKGMPMMS